jgi:Family of unknown function (DUF5906)
MKDDLATKRTAYAFYEVGASIYDFWAYRPRHDYIFMPTGRHWPQATIDAIFPAVEIYGADGKPLLDEKGKPQTQKASKWLDNNRHVEELTWAPGREPILVDTLATENGLISSPGNNTYNGYKPPTIKPGDASKATPWLNLVKTIYPNDYNHIVAFLAHRVQRPHEKINHCLILGGSPGVGKDTLLAPLRHAIGPWNFVEVSPTQLLGRFNGLIKSIILRVSEARDLGDVTRFQFYDHMKVLCASPPETLRCDEKNKPEHNVLNVCAPIITTNYKLDGVYLPPDDRRSYVAWADVTKENFSKQFWDNLWRWYDQNDGEGYRNVAAYLASYSLERFNAKAPPPLTEAFFAIVNASRSPEDAELADVLDKMKSPQATTLWQIQENATGDIVEWLGDRKNRRKVPHRLEQCGYVAVRNDDASDGLWKIAGARQVVYALATLTLSDRFRAAQELQKRLNITAPVSEVSEVSDPLFPP